MGKIKILDENLISKIAAGEIIERPASVVKELIENSLDAGANRIVIELSNGGIDLIRVVDNGCGMDFEDAKMAFERHATSKISSFEDILKLRTFGFRGEALASIAAVAKVALITREKGSGEGIHLELEGGAIKSSKIVGCREGTIIEVKDLFANVPARKKYLRSGAIEESFIIEIITKETLSHPEVAYNVVCDGKEKMNLPRTNLRDRIIDIYGKNVGKSLLPIIYRSEDGDFVIQGYITKPEVSRSTQGGIFTYVNNRAVTSKVVNNAIKEVYSQHTAKNKYPIAVVKIDMPPEHVDVNVHPAKTQVKFLDDKRVYNAVLDAVKRALESPMLTLEERIRKISEGKEISEIIEKSDRAKGSEKGEFSEKDKHKEEKEKRIDEKITFSTKRESMQSVLESKVDIYPVQEVNQIKNERFPKFELSILGQTHNMYIIAEYVDGLVLIDQHAAHERIMYEMFTEKYGDATIEKQELITPIKMELSAKECSILEKYEVHLSNLGFEIEHFGGNDYLIRTVPVMLGKIIDKEFLHELIDDLLENEKVSGIERVKEMLIQRLACRAADKSGKVFKGNEMKVLVEDLLKMKNPFACAHGRPTMIVIPFSELEKRFERK